MTSKELHLRAEDEDKGFTVQELFNICLKLKQAGYEQARVVDRRGEKIRYLSTFVGTDNKKYVSVGDSI